MKNGKANDADVPFDQYPTDASASRIHSFEEIPQLSSLPDEPIDYLVDGLIPKKTIVLLAGMDGCGKSLVTEDLALSVASGRPFLGRRCQRTPTLVLDYENPLFEVRQRFDLLSGDRGDLGDLRIWGTWLSEPPPMLGNELLLTISQEKRPLIVVDTLRAGHSGDENSSSDMQLVMNGLRYCVSHGATVVLLHHLAKGEGSQFRGSTAIRGAVDLSFVQSMSDETGLITLTCTKNRFGPKIGFCLKPDFETGTLQVIDSPEFARYNSELATLKKIIGQNPGSSQNRICELAPLMRQRVQTLLKENIGKLWTVEIGPNRSKLYHLVSDDSRPVVLSFPEPHGTTEPLERNSGGSGGSPLKGREPPNHNLQNDSTGEPPTAQDDTNGQDLTACPYCRGTAIYRESDNRAECMTCEQKFEIHIDP